MPRKCYQVMFGCHCEDVGTPVNQLQLQTPDAGPYSANLCQKPDGTQFICVQNADNPFPVDGETPIAVYSGGTQPPGGQPGAGGGGGGYGTWNFFYQEGSNHSVVLMCSLNPPIPALTGNGLGD